MSMRIQRRRLLDRKSAAAQVLGHLIRTARLNSGMTAAEVSEYLKISPKVLLEYEEGGDAIPLIHLYGLSNILDIPPRQIMQLASLPLKSSRRRG